MRFFGSWSFLSCQSVKRRQTWRENIWTVSYCFADLFNIPAYTSKVCVSDSSTSGFWLYWGRQDQTKVFFKKLNKPWRLRCLFFLWVSPLFKRQIWQVLVSKLIGWTWTPKSLSFTTVIVCIPVFRLWNYKTLRNYRNLGISLEHLCTTSSLSWSILQLILFKKAFSRDQMSVG